MNTRLERTQKQLADTKRQLYLLENGRLLRFAKFTRQSLVNPVWFIRNLGQIPSLFKKLEPIDEEGSDHADVVLPPLLGYSEDAYMSYPNLKVATFGNIPELSMHCHHIRLENPGWERQMRLGIDCILVDKNVSSTIKHRYKKLAEENSTQYIESDELESVAIDDVVFNPSGISDEQNTKPVTDSVYFPSKEEVHEYGYVICRNKKTNLKYILNILATGVPVFISEQASNIANDIDSNYPTFSEEQIGAQVALLQNNRWEWKKLSIKWRRHVLLNFSTKLIIDEILGVIRWTKCESSESVSVILSTNRPENVDNAIDSVSKQLMKNVELLLVLHGSSFNVEHIESKLEKTKLKYKIFNRPASSIFGENLNLALDHASGTYVTKMDDDDHYGENHLLDLLCAYRYSRATIVGKWTNITHLTNTDLTVTFSGGNEETYCSHLPGATIFTRTETLKNIRFGSVKRAIDSELYERLKARGGTLYSTHSNNFIRVRHGSHTYKTDDEDFIVHSVTKPEKGLDQDLYFS